MIDRAKELEGQRIIFSGSEEIANSETDEPMYTPSETEEIGFGFMQWLWITLGVLGGLLLGLILGKSFKKKNTNETEPTDEHTTVDNESIEKVKKELAEVKTSLQHQLDFDKQYFEQSFQKIIIPLEKALEARDTQTIVPLLVQTMAHYTAITRFKLEKKQSFDLANMQLMMGTTTFAKTDFPVIDKNTSPDDIPNKLKSLIALLKNAKANKVEGSIVSGYKIDNL